MSFKLVELYIIKSKRKKGEKLKNLKKKKEAREERKYQIGEIHLLGRWSSEMLLPGWRNSDNADKDQGCDDERQP